MHGLSMDGSSFGEYPPAPVWGPPQAVVWISAVAWPSPWAESDCLLWNLEHLLSILLFYPWLSQDCFSHIFFSSLLTACAVFCLFFNTFSPRHHQLGWWAQLCPEVGALEPAGIACVWTAPSLFLQ